VHGHGTGQLRRAIGAFLKEHPLGGELRHRAAESGRWRGDNCGVEGVMQDSKCKMQTRTRTRASVCILHFAF
jgi:hypothetical protein